MQKLLTLGVLLALGLGGFSLLKPESQAPLGGGSPNNPFHYELNGGLMKGSLSFPMTATSSFICSYQNPFAATSSILAVSAESTSNGIAVANNLYISTSTHAFGTTTTALVSAFAMGVGQWSVELEKNSATTTVSGTESTTGDATLLPGRTPSGATRYVLGPNEFINWKIATTTGGTFSSYNTGTCSVEIKKI